MDNKHIKAIITAELQKGTSLNDIQKLLTEEHQIKMTFFDLRLMVAELEEVLADMAQKEQATADAAAAVKEQKENEKAAAATQEGSGNTVVTMNKLVRPGALASGTVNFSSGAKAEWIFDQTGRLGLDKVDGKPTEEDIKEFQKELQKILSKSY